MKKKKIAFPPHLRKSVLFFIFSSVLRIVIGQWGRGHIFLQCKIGLKTSYRGIVERIPFLPFLMEGRSGCFVSFLLESTLTVLQQAQVLFKLLNVNSKLLKRYILFKTSTAQTVPHLFEILQLNKIIKGVKKN